ncbi:MAG: lysylphosphatidylglycerol synthase transmembrane domain-containing protein [Cytophagales bacterium]
MNNTIKKAIQIFVSIGVAAALLGYIFSIVDFNVLLAELAKANYYWIGLSIFISLISHFARGLRWNLLLEPLNFKANPFHAVQAVLAGYLANYALPRAGEVVRCSLLKKTDNVPINVSLGTVITERIVDVAAMGLIFGLSFMLEFSRLKDFIANFFGTKFQSISDSLLNNFILLIVIGLMFGLALFFIYQAREKLLKNTFILKIYEFIVGLVAGVMSITKMKKSGLFIFYTVVIWGGYFLMTYVIFFAIDDTANLPFQSGLVVLALASLGMVAPVQGGIGVYHIMVATGLLIYGIPQDKGFIVATILHTSQFLTVLVFGGISFIMAMLSSKKKEN